MPMGSTEKRQTPAVGESPIRILLGDEPSVFRDSLRALLTAQPDLEIVGEPGEGGTIVSRALKYRPDVILYDPENARSLLPVLRQVQNAGIPGRVVVLISSDSEELLSQAILNGVAGVVPKRSSTELLLNSIKKAHAGELCLNGLAPDDSVRQLINRPAPNSPVPGKGPLSSREREIVALVTQGYRNREIADKLAISEQTVKNHLHNVFEKTAVRDRLELALYSIYHGLY